MARIEKFSLTSGGSAYTLELGFVPETVEVWNYTKWANDGSTAKSYWHRGMTAGYALNELCEDTSTNHTASTSNGFTVLKTMSLTAAPQALTGITAANPPVVTVAATATYSNNDVIRMHGVLGKTEVNAVDYRITVINSTTFSLQDMAGNDIVGAGYTAYTSGGYVVNNSIEVNDAGSFRITLGTDVVGSNSDVLYVSATQADTFTALGDIG